MKPAFLEWSTTNFSLRNEYKFKYTGDVNMIDIVVCNTKFSEPNLNEIYGNQVENLRLNRVWVREWPDYERLLGI